MNEFLDAAASTNTYLEKKPNVFQLFLKNLSGILGRMFTRSEAVTYSHTRWGFKSSLTKYAPTLILGVVVLFIVIILGRAVFSSGRNSQVLSSQQAVPAVLSSQMLNREFFFPIRSEKDEVIGSIGYTLESAQLQKEIIVKGQRATAVAGRVFLILNIKIVNKDNRTVIINARDYIRLSVNNSQEWFAADVHNDPVEAQAISTKYTRLAFPINESDKNYILQVGEIKGQKTVIDIKFQ